MAPKILTGWPFKKKFFHTRTGPIPSFSDEEVEIHINSESHPRIKQKLHSKNNPGRTRRPMPVIPALSEAEKGVLLEPRSSRPAWETWGKPCLYKK